MSNKQFRWDMSEDTQKRIANRKKDLGMFANAYLDELTMWDSKHDLVRLCRNDVINAKVIEELLLRAKK